LLHVQTPGGTIFGSRAIHEAVAAYRKKSGKPVWPTSRGSPRPRPSWRWRAPTRSTPITAVSSAASRHRAAVAVLQQPVAWTRPVRPGITTKTASSRRSSRGPRKDLATLPARDAEEIEVLQRASIRSTRVSSSSSRRAGRSTSRYSRADGCAHLRQAEAERYRLIDGTLDKPGRLPRSPTRQGRARLPARASGDGASKPVGTVLSARFGAAPAAVGEPAAEVQRQLRLEIAPRRSVPAGLLSATRGPLP